MNNYTLMGLLIVMIAFMWWSSRSRKKQMEKMEQDKREQLAAVTPASGFVPASAFGAVSSTSTATLSSSRRLTFTKCTGNAR